VKFQKHSVVKKGAAILLMALMLFINAVKLFHTHTALLQSAVFSKKVLSHHSGDIQPTATSQNDHCAICDFKLAKDADVTETVIALIPLSNIDEAIGGKLPACISIFQSASPGRAPPVLL